jgi:hypothetical protein
LHVATCPRQVATQQCVVSSCRRQRDSDSRRKGRSAAISASQQSSSACASHSDHDPASKTNQPFLGGRPVFACSSKDSCRSSGSPKPKKSASATENGCAGALCAALVKIRRLRPCITPPIPSPRSGSESGVGFLARPLRRVWRKRPTPVVPIAPAIDRFVAARLNDHLGEEQGSMPHVHHDSGSLVPQPGKARLARSPQF